MSNYLFPQDGTLKGKLNTDVSLHGVISDDGVSLHGVISSSGGTSDHSQLSNRDANNQHPINAITGLQSELDGKQPIGDYATTQWVENQGYLTEHQSLDGYATEQWVESQGYLTEHQSLDGYATESYVNNHHDDTKQDTLTAGDNITIVGNVISSSGGTVDSVNGKTGAVVLTAEDVSAMPADAESIVTDVKINGSSVVANREANIPKADVNQLGVVSIWSGFGIYSDSLGQLKLVSATGKDLSTRSRYETPITSKNFDKAVEVALGDGVGAPWTDAEKEAARARLGAYSKPNGGIPKTDLTSSVQTSLGKADSALQQHQSLVGYATEQWVKNQGYLTEHQSLVGYATTQWVENQGYLTEHQSLDGYATEQWVESQGYLTEHQSLDGYATESYVNNHHDDTKQDTLTAGDNIEITSNVIQTKAFPCNQNLLDNWYFVNPVNQRGATTWANGYGIDRVEVYYSNATVTPNGLLLQANGQMFQRLEPAVKAELDGKTVSMSVQFVDGSIAAGSAIYHSTFSENTILYDDTGVTLLIGTDGNIYVFPKSDIILRAIKLELGAHQTLAHQENGVWVLNEIPNYGEQLRRCQRYYQRHINLWMRTDQFGAATMTVFFPVQMNGVPSVEVGAAGLTGSTWEAATITAATADASSMRLGVSSISNTEVTAWCVLTAEDL